MEEKLSFSEKVVKVQSELKAPKGQYNSFGKYKYRSCEDIVEAVKPILAKYNLILNLKDELVLIGDRFYIKATATITDLSPIGYIESVAYAREPLEIKGMSDSQITGTASSYARKYALNGLLAIDDTKDPDTDEFTEQQLDKTLLEEAKKLDIDLSNVAKYLKKAVNQLTNDDLKKCIEQKKKALGGAK